MRNRCFAEKVSSRPRYISASQWYPKGGERPRSSSRFSPRRPASESVKPRVMPRCNRSSSYSIDEEDCCLLRSRASEPFLFLSFVARNDYYYDCYYVQHTRKESFARKDLKSQSVFHVTSYDAYAIFSAT